MSYGEYNKNSAGGMAEWLKAAVLKTAFRSPERGFESLSLRHSPFKKQPIDIPAHQVLSSLTMG